MFILEKNYSEICLEMHKDLLEEMVLFHAQVRLLYSDLHKRAA